jgi:hypothetical protein
MGCIDTATRPMYDLIQRQQTQLDLMVRCIERPLSRCKARCTKVLKGVGVELAAPLFNCIDLNVNLLSYIAEQLGGNLNVQQLLSAAAAQEAASLPATAQEGALAGGGDFEDAEEAGVGGGQPADDFAPYQEQDGVEKAFAAEGDADLNGVDKALEAGGDIEEPANLPMPKPEPAPAFLPKAFGPDEPPCIDLPDALKNGVPPLGSLEWCRFADTLLDWFGAFGRPLADYVAERFSLEVLRKILQEQKANFRKAPFVGELFYRLIDTFETIVIRLENGVELALKVYRCFLDTMRKVFARCHPEAVIGLHLAKSIIRSLQGIQLGIDPVVWATDQLALRLDALEQLIDRLIVYACPQEVPSVPEAIEAWQFGYIGEEQRDCLIRLHGLDPATMRDIIRSKTEKLTPEQVIQLARRQGDDERSIPEQLRRVGFTEPNYARGFQVLYDELPTVQEHLRWLQRNVFNDEYVKDYKLLDGFEERFWAKFGKDLFAQGFTKERAQYEYAAHWIMPSPEQMREFAYRLRPGKKGVTTPFTATDYNRILAEQDYNSLAREWFSETLYRVPALGYLRDMYRQGVIDGNQLQEYHQDLGYSEQDSERFVTIDRIQKRRMRATQAHGWNPASIAKAVATGQMPVADAAARMGQLGWTDEETQELLERATAELRATVVTRARSRLLSTTITTVKKGLAVGTMTQQQGVQALVAVGWDASQAAGIVQLETASARTQRVQQAIRKIRSSFLAGDITAQHASDVLLRLGVTNESVGGYVSMWQLEMSPKHKRRTASEVVNDVAEGAISIPEATVRLQNLGYSDADTRLYLADASRLTVHTQAALTAARSLNGRARTAGLAAVARQSLGLSKRAVADLKRQEPLAKLLSWMCSGIVSSTYVTQRLRLYGYDDASITKHIQAAKANKKQCEPTFSADTVSLNAEVPFFGQFHEDASDTTTTAGGSSDTTTTATTAPAAEAGGGKTT